MVMAASLQGNHTTKLFTQEASKFLPWVILEPVGFLSFGWVLNEFFTILYGYIGFCQ